MSSWTDVHREVWEQVPYSLWPAGISTGWSVPSSPKSSTLGSHRQNLSHDLEALDYTMDPGYCLASTPATAWPGTWLLPGQTRPPSPSPWFTVLQGQPQQSKLGCGQDNRVGVVSTQP